MANKNFVVQNGLTVGPLTIDATTGDISTSGNVTLSGSGSLGVSQIAKNDSSITINDSGNGSTVVVNIDGTTETTIDAEGIKLPSGDAYYINGASVLNATTLGTGVTASSLTSVGTLTGLTLSGTLTGTTVNAATIGNSGATLTGTLSTAAQTNITSVGTLTGLTLSGTLTGTTVNAATIGNSGATLTGTLSTAAQTSVTSVGTLTGLTSSGVVSITNSTANNGASYLSGALQVTGGAGIGGDLYVQGNLYTANLISQTSQTLTVADPLVYLTASNPATYNYEIGLYSHFGTGATYQHTGLVRDHNDSVWKLFSNVPEPSGGTVTFTNAVYDALKIGALTSTGATFTGTVNGTTIQAATIGNSGATLTGTLSTAAQTNITSVGTLTGLTTSGQITSTATTGTAPLVIASTTKVTNLNVDLVDGYHVSETATVSTLVARTSAGDIAANAITAGGAVVPSANASINLGSTSAWWNNVYGVTFIGVATTAKYADLAENYLADQPYEPGTVLHFGGEAEVTLCDEDMCQRVAGVVSTNPAFLMNEGLSNLNTVPVAFQGRVPCKVVGTVRKGDMMVSAGNGAARAEADPKIGSVIGKALENFDGETGIIEVVVGRD